MERLDFWDFRLLVYCEKFFLGFPYVARILIKGSESFLLLVNGLQVVPKRVFSALQDRTYRASPEAIGRVSVPVQQ